MTTLHQQSEEVFRQIFVDLKTKGKRCAPRGQPVIEIENYTYTLPARARFCNFEARKVSQDYIKREMLWYLRGDRKDLEILKHAKMWESLVNEDKTINSNYGQYIFANHQGFGSIPFDYVIRELSSDKDSRRASIAIFSNNHINRPTKDLPCTYSLNFRIRENQLKMSVHMRSQDAVFGMGNDAPCFSFIHEMVYAALLTAYPDLEMGEYHHIADSFHVYERHFGVMEQIADGSKYLPVECFNISGPKEVDYLRHLIHLTYENGTLAGEEMSNFIYTNPQILELIVEKRAAYQFSQWLTTFTKETT